MCVWRASCLVHRMYVPCTLLGVVVTPASMLRWIWPILECYLKTRDSQKWPRKRWPVFSGNVEWADLNGIAKTQPISTFWKGGKTQAPACSVSGKGPSVRLNGFSSILAKPARFMQSARPITSLFQNMRQYVPTEKLQLKIERGLRADF